MSAMKTSSKESGVIETTATKDEGTPLEVSNPESELADPSSSAHLLRKLTKPPMKARSLESGQVLLHPKDGIAMENSSKKLSKAPVEEGSGEPDENNLPGSAVGEETRRNSQDLRNEAHDQDAGFKLAPDQGHSHPQPLLAPISDEKMRLSTEEPNTSPLVDEFHQEAGNKRETMKTLLVSAGIVPEEQETEEEEELEEEPLPDPGNSHFKFMKSRCGKLVNPETWAPNWQCYNNLETAESWKPVDEWAPTRQFISYQERLVIWRHVQPLPEHIGCGRGCQASVTRDQCFQPPGTARTRLPYPLVLLDSNVFRAARVSRPRVNLVT